VTPVGGVNVPLDVKAVTCVCMDDPEEMKAKTDDDNANRVPALCCERASPDPLTVAVPAVTVHVPAPLFSISTTCPVVNTDALTVIVVADAEFMTTMSPASEAVRVCDAVLSLIGSSVMAFICAAVNVCPAVNGNGVVIRP
jgi:hypothetical protein